MDIPENYIIHDIRNPTDFKGITISGYKRKDVINAFQNSMINNKLEDSIRWMVELHSTGLNKIIWESIKYVYFRYIHVNNPKFYIYFSKREEIYKKCIGKYPKKHEIFSRNDQELRNLYAELTSIAVLTKKNNIFTNKSLPIINQKSFEKEEIYKRIISKNLDEINAFIFNDTSKEIKLALNEIYTNLYSNKYGTFSNCIYWYQWIEKIDKNIQKEIPTKYNEDYSNHWVFIIWEIIKVFCKKEGDKIDINNNFFIKKLLNYYKKNFKITNIAKNKYLIFIAFHIVKNNINFNINLLQQEHLIIQVNANINKMYGNVINTINVNLSHESKNQLINNYNKLYNEKMEKNNNNSIPKKIIDTSINSSNDINVVEFTNYPEFSDLQKYKYEENNGNKHRKDNNLISKNMNLNDIQINKEDKKLAKIDIFTQFVTYKKKNIDEHIDEHIKIKHELKIVEDKDRPKRVIDFYINNNNIENNNIEINNNFINNRENRNKNENETKSIKYNKK